MMRNPIYFLFGAIACAYLAVANFRGWSFWQSVSPSRWVPGMSRFHHK